MFQTQINTVFLTLVLMVFGFNAYSQDPQYSQYYAAPLYLNPAFAGAELATRVGVNYRNQWPGMNANFSTFSAYGDAFLEEYNVGVGFLVTNDTEGVSGLQSTTISGILSYELKLGDNLYFKPGFQASYIRRDIGFYENLVFANQINPSDPFGPILPGNDIVGLGDPIGLFSASFGGLLFTDNFWFGLSTHHVNRPNQSFLDENISRLPIKYSIHTGYRISLGRGAPRNDFTHTYRERYFTPTINYKRQGPFEQLDLGGYLYLEPVVLGLWYRGLPYKPVEKQSNRDAIVLMLGFNLPSGLNMGYSFDYTVSKLGIQSGGAHEVSLSYIFPPKNPGAPRKRDTILPCPKF
ncbi:type IX secretion system membrane protein PorP/SprF [uncultured Cyclobacterium sp.]|uniref:PorP/SprF family type IX secretion system membrane protein n=1 Tax=uncultured Cyclobacterium sp. TaxID=453820 RepID=UPI0030ED98EC